VSVPELVIVASLIMLALWAVVGVVDHRAASRPAPPVPQPVRAAPPALPAPPPGMSVDMAQARAARSHAGRHRRPEGPPQ
jgi:hypothetical protein